MDPLTNSTKSGRFGPQEGSLQRTLTFLRQIRPGSKGNGHLQIEGEISQHLRIEEWDVQLRQRLQDLGKKKHVLLMGHLLKSVLFFPTIPARCRSGVLQMGPRRLSFFFCGRMENPLGYLFVDTSDIHNC